MEIELGKDYSLKASNICWTLYEKKEVQSGAHAGQIKEIPSGDHTTLKTALTRALDFKVRDMTGTATLDDVIKKIDEATAEIIAAVAHIDAQQIFRRDRVAAGGGENDNPDGLFKLPGKIAELVPGLSITSRNAKGRGETITVQFESEEDQITFADTCREQMKTCAPALKIVYKRALEVIGR